MLSEFYDLGLQLEKSGINTLAKSSKISSCPKGTPSVIVYITEKGEISKLDFIDGKTANQRYKKYTKDNFNHLFGTNYDVKKQKFKHNFSNCVASFLDDVGKIPKKHACVQSFCDSILKVDIDVLSKKVLDKTLEHKTENEILSISVVFDLDGIDNLYSSTTWDWINSRLLLGCSACTASFPFGKIYLRSMNKDAACNSRYGFSGDDSFLPAQKMQQIAKNAAEWITGESNKNKTWKWLANKTVLISYVEHDAIENFDLGLTEFLSANDLKEDTFIGKSKKLIEAIETHVKVQNPEFRAIVVSPTKKQNAHIITDEIFDFKKLNMIIDEWKTGCQNIPETLDIPTHIDCLRMINKKWQKKGGKLSSIETNGGVNLSEIYDLFFLKMSKIRIKQLLHTLVNNWKWFVLEKNGKNKKYRDWFLCLLGLLLYRIDIKKEKYMESNAYLLGRYLSLVDGLHKVYCDIKRKGKYPPEFIGSASFASFSDSPLRSFNVLGKRIKVYLGWAKAYSGTDKIELVKWYLREMGNIVDCFDNNLPLVFNRLEQSQFIIGFQSRKQISKENESV